MAVVFDFLPISMLLILISSVLSILIAIPLGILAAYHRGTFLDRILTIVTLIGICMPPSGPA